MKEFPEFFMAFGFWCAIPKFFSCPHLPTPLKTFLEMPLLRLMLASLASESYRLQQLATSRPHDVFGQHAHIGMCGIRQRHRRKSVALTRQKASCD